MEAVSDILDCNLAGFIQIRQTLLDQLAVGVIASINVEPELIDYSAKFFVQLIGPVPHSYSLGCGTF